jgi:hypothetical protein
MISRAALAAWLAFLIAALAVLHGVGDALAGQGSVAASFAVFRLVALALGWYLLAATVAAAGARALRLATLVTLLDVVTVTGVRRLVNAAFSLSLVAVSVPVLEGAGNAQPAAVETLRRLPDEPSQPPAAPSPGSPPSPPPPLVIAPPPQPPAPAATAPAAPSATWTVRPGDHFWAVAEQVLAQVWGRPPSDAEVHAYWRALVEVNRPRLRDSGNPDLLFPGQTLAVPPPPARPA